MAHPPLVRPGAPEVAGAVADGGIVAVPAAGGYRLVAAAGSPAAVRRLEALAGHVDPAHYLVGGADAVRDLADGWSDELTVLLDRCWPGPLEVLVRDAGGAMAQVGMPEGRALRRACRACGPWRTVALASAGSREVAAALADDDVACVVDAGRRPGPEPTVVDATLRPLRVARQGALPASFVEGALLMGARRRRWSGSRTSRRRASP